MRFNKYIYIVVVFFGIFTNTLFAGDCKESIDEDTNVTGSWEEDCKSTNRDSYAKFYTFTLDEALEVTINLTSDDADPFLYLMEGDETNGTVLAENDDVNDDIINSQIVKILPSGTYTIDSTQWDEDDDSLLGDFNISYTTAEATAPEPATDLNVSRLTSVSAQLNFNLDDYLDYDGVKMRIFQNGVNVIEDEIPTTPLRVKNLTPGEEYTYSIELYNVAKTSEPAEVTFTTADSTPDECTTTISEDENETGTWEDGCYTIDIYGDYIKYFTFELEEVRYVTVTTKSDLNSNYISLRAGADGESSTKLSSMSDNSESTTTSKMLEAGTYTIAVPNGKNALDENFTVELLLEIGEVPDAVTSLEANRTTSVSSMLTFDLGDVDTNNTGMRIYRGDDLVQSYGYDPEYGGWIPSNYRARDLEPDTEYTYSIELYNYAGASEKTNVTFTTADSTPDECTTTIAADNNETGTWEDGCYSTDIDNGYVKYFKFELDEIKDVTVTTKSDQNINYIFLRAGEDGESSTKLSSMLKNNNKPVSTSKMLQAGTYIIAVPNSNDALGKEFKVELLLEEPTVPDAVTDLIASRITSVSSMLNFNLGDADPDYTGMKIYRGDDLVETYEYDLGTGWLPSNYRARNLEPNTTYTYGIELFNYVGESNKTKVTFTTTENTPAECTTTISEDENETGTWKDGCYSVDIDNGYVEYFTFELTATTDVTVTTKSKQNVNYIFLGAGEDGESSTYINSNMSNKEAASISKMLQAGKYIIAVPNSNDALGEEFDVELLLEAQEPPAEPTDLTSSHTTSISSLLNFNLGDVDPDYTGMRIYSGEELIKDYGYDPEYGGWLPSNYSARGLEPNTEYTYYIELYNDSGTSDKVEVTFNTADSTPEKCTTTITDDSNETGTWEDGCYSTDIDNGYVKYFTFELDDVKYVTVTTESNQTSSYISLRAGTDGESSTKLSSMSDNSKSISTSKMLEAGTYIIAVPNDADALDENFTVELLLETAVKPDAAISLEANRTTSVSSMLTYDLGDVDVDNTGMRIYRGDDLVEDYGYDPEYGGWIPSDYRARDLEPNTEYTYSIELYNYAGASEKTNVTFTTADSTPEKCTTTITADSNETGTWEDGCYSTDIDNGYVKYFKFELDDTMVVTVTSKSEQYENYIYLRAGTDGESSTYINSMSDWDNKPASTSKMLQAGTYIIAVPNYNDALGEEFDVELLLEEPTVPDAVTDLTANHITSVSSMLNFNLGDADADNTGIKIYRGDDLVETYEYDSGTGWLPSNYIARNLESNTTYTYGIELYNYVGASDKIEVTFTTKDETPAECISSIELDSNKSVVLEDGCYSTNDINGYQFVKYHTFVLTESKQIIIESSIINNLYLTSGHTGEGAKVLLPTSTMNHDYTSSSISTVLEEGNYTIETIGALDQSLEIALTTSEPTVVADECIIDIELDEEQTPVLEDKCISTHSLDRYAKYYRFTIDEAQDILIDADTNESSLDAKFYLLTESNNTGSVIAESSISMKFGFKEISSTLEAGTYTVEVTSNAAEFLGEVNKFLISVAYDDDDDGVLNDDDNCPNTSNADQNDTDGDGMGDACDNDDDNDGVLNDDDNCPNTSNADQNDTDNDGIGDACDSDDDNDGVLNDDDNCPNTSNADQNDTDGDGMGDACDNDDDNDGVVDSEDAFPTDPNESIDTDGDGIGNNEDTDDDGDGISDEYEISVGLDPLNSADAEEDNDGDGISNLDEINAGTFSIDCKKIDLSNPQGARFVSQLDMCYTREALDEESKSAYIVLLNSMSCEEGTRLIQGSDGCEDNTNTVTLKALNSCDKEEEHTQGVECTEED